MNNFYSDFINGLNINVFDLDLTKLLIYSLNRYDFSFIKLANLPSLLNVSIGVLFTFFNKPVIDLNEGRILVFIYLEGLRQFLKYVNLHTTGLDVSHFIELYEQLVPFLPMKSPNIKLEVLSDYQISDNLPDDINIDINVDKLHSLVEKLKTIYSEDGR